MTGDASRYREVTSCRVCGGANFADVVSLGDTPLANSLVHPDQRDRPEARFPLAAVRCTECGLVQLSVVVQPEAMFSHYLYATSASAPMVGHFRDYAAEICERFAPSGSLVVEIGSNDGALLRPLAEKGIRILGVEPATNLSALANEAGLETWNEFFSPAVAGRIASQFGEAAAVLANNVLAHIDDLLAVMSGLDTVLAPGGVFMAEVPYLRDLLEKVEYDTIYHEHLSYFAVAPLSHLFESAGFELIDVRRQTVHGGSLRIFAARRGRRAVAPSVRELILEERRLGLGGPAVYEQFVADVELSRSSLLALIQSKRENGHSMAALGASAKGNTLLNYCGLGLLDIAWVADSTPQKQGLLTPGTLIPIRPETALLEERPDFTLLLAWNYADAIVRRFAPYTAAGGRFIHPVPVARVLEP